MTTALPTPRVSPRDWLSSRPVSTARHLWPMIAGTRQRREISKGYDEFGEAVTGWFARRRARTLDWSRVRRIMEAAGQFANHSEGAFTLAVEDARASVVVARHEERAIDAAFAVGFEAVRRTIGLKLHPEQLLGGLALANGCCAELATGEGKTLTAILAAAVNAWSGRGVHVITVNDYLARRDAEITSPAYRRLGLRVGVIQEALRPDERRVAYAQDITYAADKQVIFDYLRDRLASPLLPRLTGLVLDEVLQANQQHRWDGKVVQRGLYAAIVDEADSVLIDEAVTPAIISNKQSSAHTEHFNTAAQIAAELVAGEHYTVDRRHRTVNLTTTGRTKIGEYAAKLPAFWAGPRRREELLTQAINARELYRRDEDYVVVKNEIQIVDRSTGRILPGRQWQLGLHQAVEAREGIKVTTENVAVARSSYQRFFEKYERLSGMTGTASEVSRELWAWYRLPVVPIPTHKPIARTQARDRVFTTEAEKLIAVAERVTAASRRGQPVLVGTWSVMTSEKLGQLLRDRCVDCEVLNANREAEEAAIVAKAGRPGAVTVATNMAGRGTDIQLSPDSRAAGGLLVISTERNDEKRVDRQLAGRSGRQGDPGRVERFVSLEDRLIQQNGLAPLIALVRRNAGPTRVAAARFLWWFAQGAASRKWAVMRAEASKQDQWFEMAMQQVTR